MEGWLKIERWPVEWSLVEQDCLNGVLRLVAWAMVYITASNRPNDKMIKDCTNLASFTVQWLILQQRLTQFDM
jgi:hypothetical protein